MQIKVLTMKKSIVLSIILAVLLCFTVISMLSCSDDDSNEPAAFTVTFDSNGGTSVAPQSIAKDGKITEPTPKTTKNGYTFVGWFNGEIAWNFESDTVTSDIILKAKWALDTYTVTYTNLKGATNTNPATYNIERETITLAPISNSDADFLGWFDQNGNQITIIPKGSFGNIFLTARWSLKHTVSFDTNGAGSVDSQLVSDGTAVAKPQAIAKEHYTFDGWYTSDGKRWNFDTDLVTNEVKLFAKWTPIEYDAVFMAMGELVETVKFTVEDTVLPYIPAVTPKDGYKNGKWENFTLKLGGFTVNAVYTPITYSITYVNKFNTSHTNKTTFTVETETFALAAPQGKAGYVFSGWKNGNETVTSIMKGTYGNLTLEATWTPIQYNAYFYANNVYVDTIRFTVEDSVLSSTPPVPVKNGYNGEWGAYTLGAENIRIDAAYTLETYIITYGNLNGNENTNVTSYTILSDDIILADLPSDSSYEFLGWYNSRGERVTVISKGSYGNINLTAHWSGKFSIMFEANGGSPVPNSQLVLSGEYIQVPEFQPTKAGYTFDGWYYNGEKWSFDTDTVMGNITLEAHWNIITYTATFYADGSVVDTVNFTVNDNSITPPNVPNKNGYSGKWDGYTLTLDNITVNAIYTPIQYSIMYNGVNGLTHSNPTTYTVESNITLSAPSERAGYTFDGWFDSNNTLVTKINAGTTQNLTLTAKWTPITYYAVFTASGQTVASIPYTVNDATIQNIPTVPAKNGYNGAWESYTHKLGGYTVQAQYTPIIYSITYSGLFGVSSNNTVDSYTVESAKITLNAPENRLGYLFSGWKDKSGKTVTEIPTGATGNLELTASWTLINYTITYNGVNGATNTNPTSYNVETDTIVLAPLTLPPYTFIGWENENGIIVTNIPIGSTGNITLSAVFEIDGEAAVFILQNTEDGCVIVGCNNLNVTSITIPSFVTKVQSNAFKGCLSLSTVTIESNSTEIEENAFWGCISLTQINVNGNPINVKTCYTYEEYITLDGNAQLNYYNSFLNSSDFYTWLNKTKKEYDDSQNREEIGGDGEIDLS